MSLPTFNTKSPTIKRILKEASELSTHPDPTLHASPLDSDLFEWHFTLSGPPSTPYSSGIYHGRIILPPSYPLRPPSFRFLTPSGRFEVNREICLSISGHHEETWQPAWGIRTALWALRAFMEGGANGQVGGMEMGDAERKRLAAESTAWRCAGCGGRTNEEILKEEQGRAEGDGPIDHEKEENVPKELQFGFRDEMGTKPDTTTSETIKSPPDPPIAASTIPSSTSSSSAPFANPPASTTIPLSSPRQPVNSSPTSDPVPAWIDRAIVGVVAGLALMIIKKLAL